MKQLFITILCISSLGSCGRGENNEYRFTPGSKKKIPGEAVATFAQGCFWHSEIVYQGLVGVRDAVSGYSGGTDSNPDYEKVCRGVTGHAESVQVYYDPSSISFETLVSAFFASMDPTTLNRQGPDIGTHYRSIAFYRNEKEKQVIETEIRRLTESKKFKNPIVTEVVSFKKFYPAENYHQEYIYHNRDKRYVQAVSIPDYLKFRKEFKGRFKPGA